MIKLNKISKSMYMVSLILSFCLFSGNGIAQSVSVSQWVRLNSNNKLAYKTLEKGDKIMDFSFAGYMGGGVKIPVVPVVLTLSAGASDDATAIQDAIDKVSKMKLVDGFRGTVLLKVGTFNCDKQITLGASGVVLRGSGSGQDGTIINMTGDPHTGVSIKGSGSNIVIGKPASISDAYIASGSTSFNVSDVKDFAVGDVVKISRPVTEVWVHFMGMDNLVRDGKKQTWITGETLIQRTILKIEGNKITVDMPLTDSFDARYLSPKGASVVKVKTSGEISQVGLEDLRIVSQPKVVTITEKFNMGLSVNGASDIWLKNLEIINTVNSVNVGGNRVTLDNVNIFHTVATEGAAKPADFFASGSQILFNHCAVKGDNLFFFVTGPRLSGPFVLLNCVFKGNGWIQPHARWATGLLVDGCQVPDGGIDFMNRGEMGSGHGWTIGWAVAWNCIAKRYINQSPPGAANWVIGCKGAQEKSAVPFDKLPLLPEGIYDSHGTPVVPLSLYLTQLSERLGLQALKNIGYTSSIK